MAANTIAMLQIGERKADLEYLKKRRKSQQDDTKYVDLLRKYQDELVVLYAVTPQGVTSEVVERHDPSGDATRIWRELLQKMSKPVPEPVAWMVTECPRLLVLDKEMYKQGLSLTLNLLIAKKDDEIS